MANPPSVFNKIMLLAVGLLLVFGFLSYLEFSNLRDLQATQAQLQKANTLTRQHAQLIKGLKEKIIAAYQHNQCFLKRFPQPEDMLDFYVDLENFRQQKGIEYWEYNKRSVGATQDELQKIIFQLSFGATFDQVGLLINMIENHRFFFVIDQITLCPYKSKNQTKQTTPRSKSSTNQASAMLQVQLHFYTYSTLPIHQEGPVKARLKFQRLFKKYFPHKIALVCPPHVPGFTWNTQALRRDPFTSPTVQTGTAQSHSQHAKAASPAEDWLAPLLKIRAQLQPLAQQASWTQLGKALPAYQAQLAKVSQNTSLTSTNRKKIKALQAELALWKGQLELAQLQSLATKILAPLARTQKWHELAQQLQTTQYPSRIAHLSSTSVASVNPKAIKELQGQLKFWQKQIQAQTSSSTQPSDAYTRFLTIYQQKLLPTAKSNNWLLLEQQLKATDFLKKLGVLMSNRKLKPERAQNIWRIQQQVKQWRIKIKNARRAQELAASQRQQIKKLLQQLHTQTTALDKRYMKMAFRHDRQGLQLVIQDTQRLLREFNTLDTSSKAQFPELSRLQNKLKQIQYKSRQALAKLPASPRVSLKLYYTFLDPNPRKSGAWIKVNKASRRYYLGDRVAGYTIHKIRKHDVILKKDHQFFRLQGSQLVKIPHNP